jgi:Amidohydrolase family
VTAAEASDAGQKSIEHLANVAVSCSANEESLQKIWREALLQQDNALAIRDLTRVETQALDSFSPEKCAGLSERFVKNSTWHDPTLVAFRISSIGDDPALLSDPRLRYIPTAIREEWDPEKSDLSKALTKDDFVGAKRSFSNMLVEVAAMRRSGVEFLVGTDAPGVPYCFPGFSVHDEMALFVKAGLTPMEALQAATRNPAKYLGLLDSLGTIEREKIADLVLLDANPLNDIRNTQKISAVIVNGRLLNREVLDDLLAEVEEAAKSK